MPGLSGKRLVFEAHRLLYHSTLGSRVIKKKKKKEADARLLRAGLEHALEHSDSIYRGTSLIRNSPLP